MTFKKTATLLISLIFSQAILADERQEEWYTTQTGDSAVMEYNEGYLFAKIYENRAGQPTIYFETLAPDHCRLNGERSLDHNPLYINGTLVNYAQHCRGEWNLFYPETSAGRNHLIREFRRSEYVEAKTLEGHSFLFSAIGFTNHYESFRSRQGGI